MVVWCRDLLLLNAALLQNWLLLYAICCYMLCFLKLAGLIVCSSYSSLAHFVACPFASFGWWRVDLNGCCLI